MTDTDHEKLLTWGSAIVVAFLLWYGVILWRDANMPIVVMDRLGYCSEVISDRDEYDCHNLPECYKLHQGLSRRTVCP